jgi:hypothetical protein
MSAKTFCLIVPLAAYIALEKTYLVVACGLVTRRLAVVYCLL